MRIWAFFPLLCLFSLILPNASFPFVDYTYDQIEKFAAALNGPYAHVTSAASLLGTNKATSGGQSCTPSIVRVTHRESLSSDVQRPQLLLSGEIHGDERVGPSSTIHAAQLLVHAANCEISKKQDSCDYLEKEMGIAKGSDQRLWLAFLATRRDTMVIPTANCLGYMQNRREDAGVDPNRDFGYSRSDDNCLRSTTARIMNAVMSRSLMQIVITFHGGMVAIGYEWGSPNHPAPKDNSPDDNANAALASSMKIIGGTVPNEAAYPIGRINSLVYPVEGGMEDWMYAAGWDRDPVLLKNCTQFSNTASPPSNRALVFLVETSDKKRPSNSELGASENVLDASSKGNGHVPRNIRLAIMTVDIVQPYVCILSASTSSISSSGSKPSLAVKWHVGGSVTVDATWLAWHPATRSETQLTDHAGDHSYLLDALQVPKPGGKLERRRYLRRQLLFQRGNGDNREIGSATSRALLSIPTNVTGSPLLSLPLKASVSQKSAGFWADSGTFKKASSAALNNPFSVTFSATTSVAPGPGLYWVVAWATVDSSWGISKQGNSALPPQSLLVNARSNPAWRSEAGGDLGEKKTSGSSRRRQVKGRTSWPSEPILVQVGALENGASSITVVSVTTKCAWWRRERNATAMAIVGNRDNRSPTTDKSSSTGSARARAGDAGVSDNSPDPLPKSPVQIVSPGEALDSVLQDQISEELLGPESAQAETSGARLMMGLGFVLVLILAIVAGMVLSLRIGALRNRDSVIRSVSGGAVWMAGENGP